MEIITRAQWGATARPANAATWNPDNLIGIGVHWFGIPDGNTDHSKCDDQMRGVQAGHKAGEFNDIAYNHCVCPHGKVYEARGYGYQTGANGTTEANRNYAAVCVMLGKRNPVAMFNKTVQDALIETLYSWFDRGTGRTVKRHGYWTGSECPGPTIGAWVDARKWIKTEEPVADTFFDWIDDFVFWRLVTNRYDPPAPKPDNVPDEVPQRAWDIVAVAQKCIIYNGASQSWLENARQRFVDEIAAPPPGMTSVPSLWWPDFEFTHKMLNDYAAKN
jgi:hypothetical protein